MSKLLAECKPSHSSKPVLVCDNAIQPTPVLMMVCRRRRLSSSTRNDIPPMCPERRSDSSSPRNKRASPQSSLLQSPKQRGRIALSDEYCPLQSNAYDRLNHSDDLQTRTSSPMEEAPPCRWRSVESLNNKTELALPSSPRRIDDEDSTNPSSSAKKWPTTRKKTSYSSRAA
jgi:hypothetical protein